MPLGDSPPLAPVRTTLWSLVPIALGLVFAGAMHFGLGPAVGPYYTRMCNDIGIAIVLAVSLNMINGFTGQFSLGHAGFMAVGAYVGGVVTYYGAFRLWGHSGIQPGTLSDSLNPQLSHWPWLNSADMLFVSACLAGGLAAAAAGYVVGLPSLRLRGDYLAIVTLGFTEIVRRLLEQTEPSLRSPQTIAALPFWRLASHVGGSLGFTTIRFYTSPFWVYLWVTAVIGVAFRLKYSTYGRAFLAIRENEIAAASVGIPVTRFKVRAFVMAAFFAGVAGCLLIHLTGTVTPSELGFMRSFEIVIIVVLGGMGSISGSVLAAVALTTLYYALRDIPSAAQYRMIIYSLAMIIIMILRPRGLLGLNEIWELPTVRAVLARWWPVRMSRTPTPPNL